MPSPVLVRLPLPLMALPSVASVASSITSAALLVMAPLPKLPAPPTSVPASMVVPPRWLLLRPRGTLTAHATCAAATAHPCGQTDTTTSTTSSALAGVVACLTPRTAWTVRSTTGTAVDRARHGVAPATAPTEPHELGLRLRSGQDAQGKHADAAHHDARRATAALALRTRGFGGGHPGAQRRVPEASVDRVHGAGPGHRAQKTAQCK